MTVKFTRNYLGTILFVLFLMGSIFQYAKFGFDSIVKDTLPGHQKIMEAAGLFPLSLIVLCFLAWVLFDASWLNYDDEEKDKQWRTMRWIRFSILFLLPIIKITSFLVWQSENECEFFAGETKRCLVIVLGYVSLCLAHDSGFGRLFQPFSTPRNKIYTDEKGQKFEANLIGTAFSILFIVLPCWMFVEKPIERLIAAAFRLKLEAITKLPTNSYSNEMFPRVIADVVLLLLMCYSFSVVFFSCIKVNFFLNNKYNYLKFAPIPLTPVAFVFLDQLFGYQIEAYTWHRWITMFFFVFVNFAGYVSYMSPPDSFTALLFQPHVPMINQVSDLPEMDLNQQKQKERKNVVFEAEPVKKSTLPK